MILVPMIDEFVDLQIPNIPIREALPETFSRRASRSRPTAPRFGSAPGFDRPAGAAAAASVTSDRSCTAAAPGFPLVRQPLLEGFNR